MEEVTALAADPAERGAAHARLRALELRAIVALDGPGLARWLTVHDGVPAEEPRDAIGRALSRGWSELFSGAEAAAPLAELEREAATSDCADLVIEAATLRALRASANGDLTEATTLARRASRMARVEGLPHPEVLANLVLARIRRRTGAPHLAARILGALAEIAEPRFHAWIAWELAFAGERDRAITLLGHGETDDRLRRAATALTTMLDPPSAERAEPFRASAEAARQLTTGCRFAHQEAEALYRAIDPGVPLETLDGELRSWCAGVMRTPPAALLGWCTEQLIDGEARAPAYATRAGRGAARRVLGLGLGLVAAPPDAAMKKNKARQNTALSVLLLAGREGLDDETFFSSTYGFELELSAHRSALHVLKHRLRAQLPAGARLVRVGPMNRLESAQLTVPDPRCGRRTTDRVLRALAGRGASAKEVAASLDIGVRTAQKVLQALVVDGSCLARKEGRQVTYVIEDTTFQEPTGHGAPS